MRSDHEVLTSDNEHPATVDVLTARAERETRPPHKTVALYRDSATATAREIVDNVRAALTPKTRILTLTWVSSANGVKLPIAEIARQVTAANDDRDPDNRLLFVVDGVHGFGIENETFAALGSDFFVAGCHKSIFGPRGTGVIYGKEDAWPAVIPFTAILAGAPGTHQPAWRHIPGGVRAYEHQWAMAAAFRFHLDVLGKSDVEARVHGLASRFKAELALVPGVHIATPHDAQMSSGIVCFDVDGLPATTVVARLEADRIIASTSASDRTTPSTHVRFAISVLNSDDDVSRAIEAITRLAP
jgi:selenocysteine lyase/cysteine desulfurase